MLGTEPNEHVFGFLHDLVPDFTMLDLLRLVPKLAVRLMAACKRKSTKANFKKTASGYSHTYADADNTDLLVLASFPTDEEMESATKDAYEEALTLWELLGYDPMINDNNVSMATTSSNTPAEDSGDEDQNEDDEKEAHISDWQELQNAMDAAANAQTSIFLTNTKEDTLDSCGYAAAALNMAEFENM